MDLMESYGGSKGGPGKTWWTTASGAIWRILVTQRRMLRTTWVHSSLEEERGARHSPRGPLGNCCDATDEKPYVLMFVFVESSEMLGEHLGSLLSIPRDSEVSPDMSWVDFWVIVVSCSWSKGVDTIGKALKNYGNS